MVLLIDLELKTKLSSQGEIGVVDQSWTLFWGASSIKDVLWKLDGFIGLALNGFYFWKKRGMFYWPKMELEHGKP